MSIVVSASSIKKRIEKLGWPFQMSEVGAFLASQNVPPEELCAYLDACIASGDGVDDASIAGCTPANGAKISTALKNKGIVF